MDRSSKLSASTPSDIRIAKDISNYEKQNVEARKSIVKTCLENFKIECSMDNVPNIAILGSGGGLRALIALLGTLEELQECKLLDAVMYLSGVSGSTWCMSSLYENEEWGENIQSLKVNLVHKLVHPHREWKKVLKKLIEKSKDDTYSLTDFWGYIVVYIIMNDLDDHHLSDEQKICKNGKVPYPIYAAVDATKLHPDAMRLHSDTWFEFTPHEAGFFNPGAFVDVTLFGSTFENGKLKEKKNEMTMTYLRGLWGSAIADFKTNMKVLIDILKKLIFHYEASEYRCSCDYCKVALETTKFSQCIMESQTSMMESETHAEVKKHIINITEILESKGPSDTYNLCSTLKEIDYSLDPDENGKHILKLLETLQLEFTDEKKVLINHKDIETNIHDVNKFVYKTLICIFKWKWGSIPNFTYKLSELKDKNLTDKKYIQLVDAGLVINSAYPLILRPERKVKLILSFDFSEGDPFETVKIAGQHCKENKLPFPEINALNLDKDKNNPKDCYIFSGNGCPTVMHFPLFNRENCGDNISDRRNKCKTFSLSYPEKDIADLIKAARANVKNNYENIKKMLRAVANP